MVSYILFVTVFDVDVQFQETIAALRQEVEQLNEADIAGVENTDDNKSKDEEEGEYSDSDETDSNDAIDNDNAGTSNCHQKVHIQILSISTCHDHIVLQTNEDDAKTDEILIDDESDDDVIEDIDDEDANEIDDDDDNRLRSGMCYPCVCDICLYLFS